MVKNLFRVNFTNPTDNYAKGAIKDLESFRETDKAISPYIDVRVLDIPFSEADKKEIGIYGRDLITEWGNTLFVHPSLMNKFPLFIVKNSLFEKMMKKLGYEKRIVPNQVLSEGGLHIIGQEFILISDIYEPQSKEFERIAKRVGLDAPIYFMPSITSSSGGHIDLDYLTIDALKLIYANDNLFVDVSESKSALSKLEEIAKQHNYDIRNIRSFEERNSWSEEEREIRSFEGPLGLDYFLDVMVKSVNLIVNDMSLFTSYIHPEEKKFLENSGMKVNIVPLGKLHSGAGLRCVYGEFNL